MLSVSYIFCRFADDGKHPSRRLLSGSGYVSFFLYYVSMAIINSLAIGKSVKSAGNLTYKTVRGRTIASQRITSNKSNTQAQGVQRSRFGAIAQCMQLFLPYVNNFFEKTKYGSSRNQYVRLNKFINLGGLYGEIKEGIVPMSRAFLLLFGRDSSGLLLPGSAYYASFGTLSCIVKETTVDGDRISIGVETDFKANASVLFTFTTAPLRKDIKLKSYLVSAAGASKFDAAVPVYKEYTLEATDIAALAVLGYKITVAETDNIVSSILIEAVAPAAGDNSTDSVGIIVPSINNKVPTLLNIMQVQAVEPAP